MATEGSSCCQCVTRELSLTHMGCSYDNPRAFLKSQWSDNTKYFTIYKICVAVLIPVWIVMDYLEEVHSYYEANYGIWFIFASDWGFIFLGLHAGLHAVLCVYYHVKTDKDRGILDSGMSSSLKVLWIVYNIAANNALVITLSYWTYLTALDHAGFLATPMSKLKHSLNSIYILIDLMISAVPIRIFHFIYPLSMGIIYTIFNVIYFNNGGVGPDGQPYAYYVMNWDFPVTAAFTSAMGLILAVLMQCIMYVIYDLRMLIYRHFTCNCLNANSEETERILTTTDTNYSSVTKSDLEMTTRSGNDINNGTVLGSRNTNDDSK